MKQVLRALLAAMSLGAVAPADAATVSLQQRLSASAASGIGGAQDVDFSSPKFQGQDGFGLFTTVSLETGRAVSTITWQADVSGDGHLAAPGRATFSMAAAYESVEFDSSVGLQLNAHGEIHGFHLSIAEGVRQTLGNSGSGPLPWGRAVTRTNRLMAPSLFIPPAQTLMAGIEVSVRSETLIFDESVFDVRLEAEHPTAGRRTDVFSVRNRSTTEIGIELDEPGLWTVDFHVRPFAIAQTSLTIWITGMAGEGLGACGDLSKPGDTAVDLPMVGRVDPCTRETWLEGPLAVAVLYNETFMPDYGFVNLGSASVLVESATSPVAPVPVPPTLGLAFAAFGALGLVARRRSRHEAPCAGVQAACASASRPFM